ncbi:hypothetical protein [uncultured Thiocystis sp.]|jgi:hypothetical protein|uniref:hypothetical protein n=1 Tax=uncultured Thiocystis sp. TaxID=1202134 RepID=UPI0025F3795E|nr:hypothetical protein [uncultured Thiocystis sp.]
MNDQTEITPREPSQTQRSREGVYPLRPAVNVFEDAEGITLEADIRGASRLTSHPEEPVIEP